MKKTHKAHSFFVDGAISFAHITKIIAKHATNPEIGAHSIFLGQVRNDKAGEKTVSEIHYSAYREMAEKEFLKIENEIREQYEITCLHILHSEGKVQAGEVSLFAMVSAKHRENTFGILKELVDRIKKRVPIWKKEIFSDGTHRWIQ